MRSGFVNVAFRALPAIIGPNCQVAHDRPKWMPQTPGDCRGHSHHAPAIPCWRSSGRSPTLLERAAQHMGMSGCLDLLSGAASKTQTKKAVEPVSGDMSGTRLPLSLFCGERRLSQAFVFLLASFCTSSGGSQTNRKSIHMPIILARMASLGTEFSTYRNESFRGNGPLSTEKRWSVLAQTASTPSLMMGWWRPNTLGIWRVGPRTD